jgi:DNA-binding transcriptional LysR family regulator
MQPLSSISLKSLHTFRALFETQNASRAAVQLGISQSGVSRSLAELESRLAMQLFLRDKNRLIATPEAEALYRESERVVRALMAMERNLDAVRDFGVQRLRVAAVPALGPQVIPQAIARALHGMRGVSVVFEVMSSSEAVQAAASGLIDVAFVTDPVDAPELCRDAVLSTEAVCLLPKNHELAQGEHVHVKNLARQALVLATQPHPAVQAQLDLFKHHGVRPGHVTHSNIVAMGAFVASGAGVGIINAVSAREYIAAHPKSRLCCKPLRPEISYSFAMVYEPKWSENSARLALRAAVSDVAQGLTTAT